MNKVTSTLLYSFVAFTSINVYSQEEVLKQPQTYTSTEINVESRDTIVPATFVVPNTQNDEKYPLVLISHGHGGDREENGGLTLLAETLAEKGIASIRMDYAGCGKSSDSFVNNTPENMLSDTQASLEFALKNGNVDIENIATFGYSMGGRISMDLSIKDSRIKAAAFLAPGTDDGNTLIQRIVGSEDVQNKLYQEASTNKGYADFTTKYGTHQKLSKQWFDQLTQSNPVDDINNFKGDIFVVCGTDEISVRKEACVKLVASTQSTAKSVSYINIQDADHGYGFWNGRDDVKNNTINAFVDFFVEKLK